MKWSYMYYDFYVIQCLTPQTVVVQSSCDMHGQLLKERMWRCLHSLKNSLADMMLLPGAGLTESWCAQWLLEKAQQILIDTGKTARKISFLIFFNMK